MTFSNSQKQALFKKYSATQADLDRYKERYKLYIKYALTCITFFIIGSWIIIPFLLPQDYVCKISGNIWIASLWYPNHQYAEVLARNSWSKIDSCRLISATSWASFIGLILLVSRLIIEFKFKEFVLINPKWSGLFLTMFALLAMSILQISEHKYKTLYGLAFGVNIFDSEIHAIFILSFWTIFSYFLLCEGLSISIITLRNEIKRWRKS